MTVTVLKTTFPEAEPRIISYRTAYETKYLLYALGHNFTKMKEDTYEGLENAVTLYLDIVSTVKRK